MPGACVDRSVIQRAHTVSIMDPFAVCVRSGRGDTGGLPNKNTCCKQEAAARGKRELRVRVSNAFFFFSPCPLTTCNFLCLSQVACSCAL